MKVLRTMVAAVSLLAVSLTFTGCAAKPSADAAAAKAQTPSQAHQPSTEKALSPGG